MGFIAYQVLGEIDRTRRVRILMECQPDVSEAAGSEAITYSYAVDVQFIAARPGQPGCTLHGIEEILALKKFYKLVFSLEERAREHGHAWQEVFASADGLIEHLGYTKNARRLGATANISRRETPMITAS